MSHSIFDSQLLVPFGTGLVVGYLGKCVGRLFYWSTITGLGCYQVAVHNQWCSRIDYSSQLNQIRLNGNTWLNRIVDQAESLPEGYISDLFSIGLIAGILCPF